MKRCNSCGKQTKDFAPFPCPKCGAEIIRCLYCRNNKNPYACACGFKGP